MSEAVLFGLDWIQLFTILGVIGAGLIHFYPNILLKFRGFKAPVGDAFYHYRGVGGIAFQNIKAKESLKPTQFTTENGSPIYTAFLENGITLPNLNIDENDSKCNAILIKTATTFNGIVDIYTCIDAHGQETPWDNAFLSSYGTLLQKMKEDLVPVFKRDDLTQKEFNDSMKGDSFVVENDFAQHK